MDLVFSSTAAMYSDRVQVPVLFHAAGAAPDVVRNRGR
jgi:hypothetical protein